MNNKDSIELPFEEFLDTFKKVPRFAISLLIINSKGDFLLAKRNIEPEKGKWHLPGSFLLKGETIADCQRRIALKEIGTKLQSTLVIANIFENLNKDPRGHVIDAIYKLKIDDQFLPKATDETSQVRFFEKIPTDMGFNHGEVLQKLGYELEV